MGQIRAASGHSGINKRNWLGLGFCWSLSCCTELVNQEGNFAHLSNGHGTKNVEEDEATVRVVSSGQVPMRDPLKEGNWDEWEFSNNSSVKTRNRNESCKLIIGNKLQHG